MSARLRLRRALPRLAFLAMVWGVLSGGVFSGCRGLFTPAIPEAPTGPPIVLDYSEPVDVLRTMTAGLEAKAQGSSAWLGGFADAARGDSVDYHQVFDAVDLSAFEASCGCAAPTDWQVSQEREFYGSLVDVRPSDEYAMAFDSLQTDPDPAPADHKVTYFRKYTLIARDPDSGSSLIIGIGFARLTFTEVEVNRWAISRWEDQVDPDVGGNPGDERLTLGRRRMESIRR